MRWSRSHPVRLVLLLGFAAIALSTAGALFALHPRDGSAKEKKAESLVAATGDKGLVCSGYVDVEGGVTPLAPLQPGRVAEVAVRENDKVKAKQVLLRMDSTLAEQRLREAKADLAAAEAKLHQAESLPGQHDAQVAQQKAAIEAANQRMSAAKDIEKRKADLARLKQIDQLEADAAAKLAEEAKSAMTAEQEKLKQLTLVDPKLQIARAKADVDARALARSRPSSRWMNATLRAPADGEILLVQVSPGSVITGQSAQPSILFVARKPRIVRAEVEQEFADRLSVNQAVTVKDEARRKETWTGKVKRVSDWYTQRRSSAPDTLRISNNEVHVLECIIELGPNQAPLRMGQRSSRQHR